MTKTQVINGDFKGKDFISIDQLDRKSVDILFQATKRIKKLDNHYEYADFLKNQIITLLFVEPSSRTFSSFASAVKKLGGQTIEHQNPAQNSSMVKGETLEDTVRVLENYSEAIVMRHPQTGAAQRAAQAVLIPVINAGDGAGEHPTQAMLDLFTIYGEFGKVDGVKGLICGDALYGRGIHSLLKGFSLFKNVTIYLLAPPQVKLTKELFNEYKKRGVNLIELHDTADIPKDCQFWYWTRLQKERYGSNLKGVNEIKTINLTPQLIKEKGNKDMIIMHILPRIDEVDIRVDLDPRVIFLSRQLKNGLHIRMALLSLIFGKL